MPKYNIIFTSPNDDPYLWNGASFNKLEKTNQEVLRFSGKAFEEDELKDALKEAIDTAKKMFPGNTEPVIKVVEIKVV